MRKIALFLFAAFSPLYVHAAANWIQLDNASQPWGPGGAQSMQTFNSYVFVGSTHAKDASFTRIWRSPDMGTWEPLSVSTNEITQVLHLVEHETYLYAFCMVKFDGGVPRKDIFRTANGTTWESVLPQEHRTTGVWDSAASWNGRLYVTGGAQAYSTDGAGSAPTWQSEIGTPLYGGHNITLTVYNNELFAARLNFANSAVHVYRNNGSWIMTSTISYVSGTDLFNKHNFAVYRSTLYFSYERLWMYIATGTWRAANERQFTRNFLIFSIKDHLHVKLGDNDQGGGFQSTVYGQRPSWGAEIVGPSGLNFALNHAPVIDFQNEEYVLLGDIWTLSHGIVAVTEVPTDFDPVDAGADNVDVLSWTLDLSFDESLQHLVVENKGSAESVTEIESVTLYREGTLIVALEQVPGETKQWRTPAAWSELALLDWDNETDNYYLKVKISPTARENRNIRFSIATNGITWGTNASFVLNEAIEAAAGSEKRINAFGVNSVTRLEFTADDFSAGQEDLRVLRFDLTFYSSETMKSISVVNKETAEAGTDIAKVKLHITAGGTETTVELVADPDLKTWTSPPGWTGYLLDDDAEYEILADISSMARRDRKIKFALEPDAFTWDVNTDFVIASELVEDDILDNTAAGQPLPPVIAFPNPARDRVGFSYDLTSPAAIEINIFNLSGNLVSEIRESKTAGIGVQTFWEAAHVAPGPYFAVVKINAENGEKRVYKQKVYIKK